MKKLNLPLILSLGIGSMVALVGIHFLHGYQVSRSAESLLARADKAAEAGDVSEQIRLLTRYLRHRKDDVASLKKLLKVLRDEAFSRESGTEVARVVAALEKAVRDNPDDAELRREAYQTMFMGGRVSDAVDHLDALEEMNALLPEDRISLARGLWITGKQDEGIDMLCKMVGFDLATATFDETKATDPKQVSAYSLLNQMYVKDKVQNNDMTVPAAIMDRCVEVNPDQYDSYLNRALYVQRNEEGEVGQEKSVSDLRKAVELAPDNLRVLTAAVSTAMAVRDTSWAEGLLTKGLEQHPDNPAIYAMRAELARSQDDIPGAIDWIDQGLKKSQLNGELLYRRANYQIDSNLLEDAEQTISRLQDKRFDTVRLELLRARVSIAREDFVDARGRLEKLQPLAVKGSQLEDVIRQNLTVVYRRLNMPDMLERLLGTASEDPNSQFNQAELLQRQGKYDEALAIYQKLLEKDERLTPEGKELIFRNVLSLSIERERQKPEAQRDWTQVDKMANMLLSRPGVKDYEKELFTIDLLIQKGQLEEARRRAERGTQAFPQVAPFPLMLVELTPDSDQANKILQMVEQRIGDNVALRLARAKRIVKDGGEDMANRLAELEVGLERFPPEDQQRLNQTLANLYQRVGDSDRAMRIIKKLAADNPKNPGLPLVLFDLAYASNNLDEMNAALKSIEELSKKSSAEWQICEANRQLWLIKKGQRQTDDLQDIVDLIEKARAQRPDFGPIFMARGEVLLLQGQAAAAIEAMQLALEKRPGELTYMQRLSEVLAANGREKEAGEILAQMPNEQKRTGDVVAEIRILLTQDPARALERAKESFSSESEEPEVLLFLADVHQAVGQVAESLPLIERALKFDDTLPRAWLIYVRSLMILGRKDEAIAAMDRMRTGVASDAHPLLLGQCYTTIGDFPNAEKELERGLASKPNDTVLLRNLAVVHNASKQEEKLLATLDRLMSIQGASDPESLGSIAWARRTKAQKLAATGIFQDFQAALKLLDLNRDSTGELEGEDLITWLRIVANRPEAESRAMAVNKLNQIREQRPLNSVENGVLAYVHYQEGRWHEAQTIMIDLLAKNPDNVAFVTTYIDWLIERKDFSNAGAWVRKLNPNSLDAVRYACILLAQDGKAADAAKRIMALVPAQINLPTAAAMLEELGKYDKRFYTAAKQQWKKFADANPNQVGFYIDYLTRMPEASGMTEALDLIQQPYANAVQEGKKEAVQYYLTVVMRGLRKHKRSLSEDSPYFARVEQMIEQALAVNQDDLTVIWQQVDYYDVRTDYTKLQTLYLEMLKRSDLDRLQLAVVRNNLAFVYAISNQGDKALETIGDAISQLGPRSDFLDTRGLAYLASGQFEAALKDLRGAVDGGQGAPATYFHLALAEQRSGNVPEAAAAIQRALDMGLVETDLSKPEVNLYRKLMKELEPQLKQTSVPAES